MSHHKLIMNLNIKAAFELLSNLTNWKCCQFLYRTTAPNFVNFKDGINIQDYWEFNIFNGLIKVNGGLK